MLLNEYKDARSANRTPERQDPPLSSNSHQACKLNSLPVLLLDSLDDGIKLLLANVHRLVRLPLLERLPNAKDDLDLLRNGSGRLLGDEGRGVVEEGSSLGVTNDNPGDGGRGEHVRGDLARKGARANDVAVLGGDGDGGVGGSLGSGGEIDGRGCDDDLCLIGKKERERGTKGKERQEVRSSLAAKRAHPNRSPS
jgi:hypothetical protein